VVRAEALSRPATVGEPCAACGASLAEDQEWCLECGAARTQLHTAPDWRIPAAVVGVVVALVLIGLLIALVSLSIQANHA
jgi:hypothetical protein